MRDDSPCDLVLCMCDGSLTSFVAFGLLFCSLKFHFDIPDSVVSCRGSGVEIEGE